MLASSTESSAPSPSLSRALCFHPGKPAIATGSQDHSVKLWNYAVASRQQIFLGIDVYPRSLSFPPNGRLLTIDGRTQFLRCFAVDAKPQ